MTVAVASLDLEPKPLGQGGYGAVFAIQGDAAHVLKVSLDDLATTPRRTPEERRNESAYLDYLITRRTASLAERTAWPVGRRRASLGSRQVSGLLLPRISGRDGKAALSLFEVYNPATRLALLPQASWLDAFTLARELAETVAVLHGAGFVHGDLNHRNVLLDGAGRPHLIDVDGAVDPNHPLAPQRLVCGEDYRAPETFLSPRGPNEGHDRYALAVLFYQLLMQGGSPFAGLQSPDEPDVTFEDMVRLGQFTQTRLRRNEVHFDPPLTAPSLDILPPSIAALFEHAFDPSAYTTRPSAKRWAEVLSQAEAGLSRCTLNPRHFHRRDASCGWCALDARALSYFGKAPPKKAPTTPARRVYRRPSPPPPTLGEEMKTWLRELAPDVDVSSVIVGVLLFLAMLCFLLAIANFPAGGHG